MEKELRILILEDVPADAELIKHELKKGGILFASRRIETKEGFLREVKEFAPDIILSDYRMPQFDGITALSLTKELAPNIPFIIVTGSMNEEIAVECMKAGAADYVIKDRLARISLAVKGALKNKQVRDEKERLQKALWTSAREWRATFDSLNHPVALMDLDRSIRRCNKAMANLLGRPFSEIIGRNCCGLMHSTSVPIEGCPIVRMRESRHRETLVLSIGERWFDTIADPVFDEDGNFVGAVHTMSDITERKRSEEVLRQNEERLRQLFDYAPMGYFEYDGQGRIIRVNRTELEMLGYSAEEMIGQPVWKFVVEEEDAREKAMAKLAGVLPPARNLERTYRRKDGITLPVLIEDRLLRDSEGKITGMRTTIQDITERKRAEKEMASLQEQLRQSQRMEAIGRLAGGVAHDFNNLLTIIRGNSQLSLMDLKEDDPLKESLEDIQKATDKASDLIRQLLAFSRRQIMELRVLDLNSVLRNLDKMLRRVIGEDLEIATVLSQDLGRAKADSGQIEQVILNLAVNARDAMLSGGKLTIETANVDLDEDYARRHVAVKPGRYVMLSVSDTGTGMTREVQERIFEPFFTTKERDKGTGLGLSTVYGIVKQSGGNIWVYSEPGKGSTFKIYLPQVEEPLEEIREKTVEAEIPRGNETILIAEDSEEVRKLAAKMLRRRGYKVLEASHGDEALSICKQHQGRIHLLVTDIVMPRMSGRELAGRLAEVQPRIKVLYMSGYTDNAVVHHGVLDKGTHYIQKPFTLEGMARAAREVLDE